MASTATASAPILLPTPIKLDGSNFLLWKTITLPNLSGQNLHGHLDGTTPAPEAQLTEGDGENARSVPNPYYMLWWQQDQRVLVALLSSMTPEIATQMFGLHTAAQVWTAVHSMFSAQNRATIRYTRMQLQTLKKHDMTAAQYFQKMKALADTLATIGSPLSDDELIDYMLAGLGPQYGPLAASLAVINRSISLTDFYAYLLSYEAMQDQHSQYDDWSSSANSAAKFNGFPNSHTSHRPYGQNSRDRCEHQPRRGSHGGRNPTNGGQPGGRTGGGRNRSGGGRFRPQCQICQIHGHDTLNCPNRFNKSYRSEEARSGNSAYRHSHADPTWFIDSGATDHLTYDLERLTLQERYTGKDKIQVANGTGLSITHIGHSCLTGSPNSIILKNILHGSN